MFPLCMEITDFRTLRRFGVSVVKMPKKLKLNNNKKVKNIVFTFRFFCCVDLTWNILSKITSKNTNNEIEKL